MRIAIANMGIINGQHTEIKSGWVSFQLILFKDAKAYLNLTWRFESNILLFFFIFCNLELLIFVGFMFAFDKLWVFTINFIAYLKGSSFN